MGTGLQPTWNASGRPPQHWYRWTADHLFPEAIKAINKMRTCVIHRDGDHYDALRDCLKALTLNPGHLKAHFRLARCLFELKYVTEALECLDDFKGKFPEQAHSSACDALDKDIKAALFSKTESGMKEKITILKQVSAQLDLEKGKAHCHP